MPLSPRVAWAPSPLSRRATFSESSPSSRPSHAVAGRRQSGRWRSRRKASSRAPPHPTPSPASRARSAPTLLRHRVVSARAVWLGRARNGPVCSCVAAPAHMARAQMGCVCTWPPAHTPCVAARRALTHPFWTLGEDASSGCLRGAFLCATEGSDPLIVLSLDSGKVKEHAPLDEWRDALVSEILEGGSQLRVDNAVYAQVHAHPASAHPGFLLPCAAPIPSHPRLVSRPSAWDGLRRARPSHPTPFIPWACRIPARPPSHSVLGQCGRITQVEAAGGDVSKLMVAPTAPAGKVEGRRRSVGVVPTEALAKKKGADGDAPTATLSSSSKRRVLRPLKRARRLAPLARSPARPPAPSRTASVVRSRTEGEGPRGRSGGGKEGARGGKEGARGLGGAWRGLAGLHSERCRCTSR